MRRYTIEIDGRRFEVDVEEAGEGRYGVAVGDSRFEVTLAGQQELGQAQITPQMRAAPAGATTPVAPAAAAGAPTRSAARPASAVAPASAAAGAGGDTLAAPMPGLILRVAVAPGTQVRRGQDIAVLEAMKMENVIRSPRDAVVAEVCVEAGQQVAHGAPIVRFAVPAAA